MRLRHGNGHVQTHQTDQFVTRFKLVLENRFRFCSVCVVVYSVWALELIISGL